MYLLKQSLSVGYAGDVFHRAGGRGNKHYMRASMERMNTTFFLQNHYKYHDALIKQEGRRVAWPKELNDFIDSHASGHLKGSTG